MIRESIGFQEGLPPYHGVERRDDIHPVFSSTQQANEIGESVEIQGSAFRPGRGGLPGQGIDVWRATCAPLVWCTPWTRGGAKGLIGILSKLAGMPHGFSDRIKPVVKYQKAA